MESKSLPEQPVAIGNEPQISPDIETGEAGHREGMEHPYTSPATTQLAGKLLVTRFLHNRGVIMRRTRGAGR